MLFRNQNRLFGARLMDVAGGEDLGGGGGATPTEEELAAAKKAEEEAAAAAAASAAGGEDDPAKQLEKLKADLKKEQDEKAKLLKESMSRKEKIKEFETALKQFEGIDPEVVRKMIEEKEAAEAAEAEKRGEFDRVKAQMIEKHNQALAAAKSEAETARAEISKRDQIIAQLNVGHAFDSSKFISDELTLTPSKARVVYGDHFDVVDGKVVAFNKPRGAAERTMIVDGTGNAVAFEDALKAIVEADPEKDALLKSKIKPGAGSATVQGKPAGGKPVEVTGASRIAKAIAAGKGIQGNSSGLKL